LRKRKRARPARFYIRGMTFLLMNLLVLAAVTAAMLFAYARVLRQEQAEASAAPGVDYAALQARWQGERQARDWDSLRAQVRRWHGVPGSGPDGTSSREAEQAARALNEAVFRFAMPGEPLSFHDVAGTREARRCPAARRVRALG
jgi:hypothetical protein